MTIKRLIKGWLIHSAIAWVLINLADLFTYLLLPGEPTILPAMRWRFVNHNLNQPVMLYILTFCLVVEINYQVLFKRLRTRMLAFACSTIACAVVVTILLVMIVEYWNKIITVNDLLQVPVFYILYAGFYIFIRDHYEGKKLRAQQKQQQTQAELNALKAQLNPHFFFNTLNTLYGTALQENAHKTAEIVDMLSTLTRYIMEKTTTDITTIGDEIKFIEHYFSLQQLRLPEKESIIITSNITCTNAALAIPPLLFIPFIENAFKYGISIDKPCFIYFTLSANKSSVFMQLDNSILRDAAIQPGEGTGIINATKRLQLLYAGKHTINIASTNNTFSITLTINL